MKIVSVLISAFVFLRVAHGDEQTGRRVTDNANSSEVGGDDDPFRQCKVFRVLFFADDLDTAWYSLISSNGYDGIPFYSPRSYQLLGLYNSLGLLQPNSNRVGEGSYQLYSPRQNGTDFSTQLTFAFTNLGGFAAITGGSLLASGVKGYITPFTELVPDKSYYKLLIICDADFIELNRDRFGIDDTPHLFNEPSIEVINGVLSSDGTAGQSSIADLLASYQGMDMQKAH